MNRHRLLASALGGLGLLSCAPTPPPEHAPAAPPPTIEVGDPPPLAQETEAAELPPPRSPAERESLVTSEMDDVVPVANDADGDGIADGTDLCPSVAEDLDGYEDADGCPEPDNDGDGIADVKDKCPTVAEDFNGVQDQDGCPEAKPGGGKAASGAGTASQLQRARQAFMDGLHAYEQGDYTAARKHFEAAYALAPRDPILFNLARTAFQQGHRQAACRYYRKWKATPRGKTGPSDTSLDKACP